MPPDHDRHLSWDGAQLSSYRALTADPQCLSRARGSSEPGRTGTLYISVSAMRSCATRTRSMLCLKGERDESQRLVELVVPHT